MLPVLLPFPPGGLRSGAHSVYTHPAGHHREHSVYTHHPEHRSHPGQALLLTRSVTAGSPIPQTTSLHAPRATPYSSRWLSVPITLCLYSPSQTQITPGAGTSAHPHRASREPHTRHHLPACSPCYSLFLPLAFRPEHTLSILTIPNTDHTRSRHFHSPAP